MQCNLEKTTGYGPPGVGLGGGGAGRECQESRNSLNLLCDSRSQPSCLGVCGREIMLPPHSDNSALLQNGAFPSTNNLLFKKATAEIGSTLKSVLFFRGQHSRHKAGLPGSCLGCWAGREGLLLRGVKMDGRLSFLAGSGGRRTFLPQTTHSNPPPPFHQTSLWRNRVRE